MKIVVTYSRHQNSSNSQYSHFKASGILYHQSPHNDPTRSVLYGDFLGLPRPIKLSFTHPLARSYGVLTEKPAENHGHYKLEEPSYRMLPSTHSGRWTGLEKLGIKLSCVHCVCSNLKTGNLLANVRNILLLFSS